ncbi:MAG: hypothetical protein HYZ75_07330 [Elusimicrobia bacterium]|nr:hypothetical protein [Elusimicrobiota bacterium]
MKGPLVALLGAVLAASAAEPPRLPPGVDLGAQDGGPVMERLVDAFRRLESAPTGAGLLASAVRQKVRWKLDDGQDWMYYSQNDNEVRVGRAFVERYRPEQLAYMFAHELEHARQVAVMGAPPGYNADELEFGALSAQSRVWAELGAPAEPEAWKAGRAWLKDNALWLTHPEAAYFSWRLRRYPRNEGLSDVDEGEGAGRVKAYWLRLAEEDAAWRRAASLPAMPPERTLEAFRGVMDASLRVALDGRDAAPGTFSAWLPDFLQALPALKEGEDFPLSAAPAPKDLQLLAFLEHEVAVYQLDGGAWKVRKGSERSVPLDDLRGKLRVLAHNHPARIQGDALGRAPSSRDFFDDEAPHLFLVTQAGLIRYKMPARLRDPKTGELFDPRALSYQAFRDRIYGEAGPPYTGELAQASVRDPAAFYRGLGMEVSFRGTKEPTIDWEH